MFAWIFNLCIFAIVAKTSAEAVQQNELDSNPSPSEVYYYSEELKEDMLMHLNTGIESRALNDFYNRYPPSSDITRLEVEQMTKSDQNSICIICRAITAIFFEYVQKEEISANMIRGFIVNLCAKLKIQVKEVCEGFYDLNWPVIDYIISNKDNHLDEDSVCSVLLQGSNCTTPDERFDWTVKVSSAGSVVQSKPPGPPSSAKDIKIVQITDIHYDPNYREGSLAECNKPMCCIEDVPSKLKGKQVVAGKWSDYRNCDVPFHLYTDTLKHIKKTHRGIDYIYYTGDTIDHGVWRTSYAGNIDAFKKIYREMKKAFGNTPVFPIIGNHESQPLNQYAPDYIKDPALGTQWLYNFLAEEWTSLWLPESTKETIKKGGYYTAVPKKGFRIIALNNNDCYTFNFWILHDPQYLKGQLQWLHDTLLEAEKAKEHVHILMHVPSGTGSSHNTWSREYRRIIERFHRIIGGVFTGHTHRDEFSVIYSQNSKYAINVDWNGGSLTPYSFVNPNYRVYEVETNTYQVVTHDTWIFNLTLANMHPDESPAWFKEYSFGDAYGLTDLSPASLHELLNTFAKNHTLLNMYWQHKVKLGDPSLAKGCDNECLQKHLCEAATSQFNDKKRCQQLRTEFQKTLEEQKGRASLQTFSTNVAILATIIIVISSVLH